MEACRSGKGYGFHGNRIPWESQTLTIGMVPLQLRTLVAGFLGFMMFKVAVLGVAALPAPSDDIPLRRL